jgi:hypothetical protein
MARSASLLWLLGAFAASCLVPIDEVEDKPAPAAGAAGASTAGAAGAAAGGSAGSSGGAGGIAGGSLDSGSDGSSDGDAQPDASNPDCPGGVLALQEDFEDGQLSPQLWTKYASANASVSEKDGVLEFDLDVSPTPTYAFLGSQKQYDLSGCNVFVKIAEVTKSGNSAYSTFGLASSEKDYVIFAKSDGYLDLEIYKDDVSLPVLAVPYNPLWHRWWRFRVDSKLHWDVSADGSSWTELASTALPFSLSAVSVVLEAAAEQPESIDPGRFRIDSLNVPP